MSDQVIKVRVDTADAMTAIDKLEARVAEIQLKLELLATSLDHVKGRWKAMLKVVRD